MSNNIGWCDITKNPLIGCSPASIGCQNCYAASDTWIRQHNPKSPHYQAGLTKSSGVWSGEIVFRKEVLEEIRRLKKPQRIFLPSLSDPFHSDVKEEWLDEIFNCIYDCPHLTFQMLTKRPERMLDWISRSAFLVNSPLENLWLGTSIENQQTANERCHWLTQLTDVGYTTFLSIEPLLSRIDLVAAEAISKSASFERGVSWAIIGAESGHNARPCSLDWMRSIINQCRVAVIPVYVKQLGTAWAKSSGTYRLNSKGSNPEAWEPDLRIREFPRQQPSESSFLRARSPKSTSRLQFP